MQETIGQWLENLDQVVQELKNEQDPLCKESLPVFQSIQDRLAKLKEAYGRAKISFAQKKIESEKTDLIKTLQGHYNHFEANYTDSKNIELILDELTTLIPGLTPKLSQEEQLIQQGIQAIFQTKLNTIANEINKQDNQLHCFISYTWGVSAHEKIVHRLAIDLQRAGSKVTCDKWDNNAGKKNFRELQLKCLWKVIHERVTYNKYYETYAEFRDVTLNFLKTIGRNKKLLRSRITDNFQVVHSPVFAS